MFEILLLAISKDIISNWLKDKPPLLQRISEEFIDKCSEHFSNQNKYNNASDIEKIADSIVQQFALPFDNIEASSLKKPSKEAIVLAVCNTLSLCKVTDEYLAQINLDKNKLAQLFQNSNPDATKLLSQKETDLYQKLLLEISHAVVLHISQLPLFKSVRDAALLERTDSNAREHSYTQNQLHDIENQLTEILGRLPDHQKNNKKDISEILVDAKEKLVELEAKNPGLRFELIQTPESPPRIVCTAKMPGANSKIGTLSFPNTESGKNGQQKYKELIERDIPILFCDGEVTWEWGIQLASLFNEPVALAELSLTKLRFENKLLPVKLEFLDVQENVLRTISYANLEVDRLGTQEQEVNIIGNKIPGRLNLILNQVSQQVSISHTSSIFENPLNTDSDLEDAAEALDFRSLLIDSDRIQAIYLENEKLLFAAGNQSNFDPEFSKYLRCKANLFRWLATINKHFGTSLRPPDKLEIDTYTTAEELFLVITKGEFQDGGGQIIAQCDKSYATQMVNAQEADKEISKNTKFTIENVEARIGLLNESFLGQAEITLIGLSLAEDADTVQERISLAKEVDVIEIAMNYRLSYKKYLSLAIDR